MGIIRLDDLPEGSGSLSNDDIFLFMDDPSNGGTTKKISLSEIGAAIGGGGGGNADTGDVSFNGIQIIGTGTLELVPNSGLYNNDQYLVVDPTAPNHIHLRAGGNIDSSNAELIVGGENSNVRIGVGSNPEITIKTAGSNTVEFLGQIDNGFGDGPGATLHVTSIINGTITDGMTIYGEGLPAEGWVLQFGTVMAPQGDGGIGNYYLSGANYLIGSQLFNNSNSTNNIWTFGNDGNLSIPGNIILNNGTTVATGTYDNNTGGNNGISLNCAVGYELNWQGGHLRSSEIGNSSTTQPLFVDSPIQIPGTGVSNMTISASGLTFPDGSSQISAATSGLSDSDRYVICKAGDDIAAKYSEAKALTPGGSSKSATNRAYLIVMPGVYPLSAQWEIDAEFVDVIGLGSTPLDRGCNVAVTVTGYNINASADNVRIKGIGTTSDRAFQIGGNKPLQVLEECIGGDYSFGGGGTASGSFINCSGGDYSFGGTDTGRASGSFINCSGGDYSFGGTDTGGSIASGTFTNCSGGNYSFAGLGSASGTFTNCSGGYGSFGGYGTAGGTFKDCSGGNLSFGGGGGTASGKFLRCTLTTGTFPTLSGTGKYRLCIDGNYDVINADAPPPTPRTLYFNSAVDYDWQTLGNWWTDDTFTTQATSLPTSMDNVIVYITPGLGVTPLTNSGGQPTVANITFPDHNYLVATSALDITVIGLATFNNYAMNSGTINGNATFNNWASNEGIVTGTATFNDSACNNGGTAGTFVPDPPPTCQF